MEKKNELNEQPWYTSGEETIAGGGDYKLQITSIDLESWSIKVYERIKVYQ